VKAEAQSAPKVDRLVDDRQTAEAEKARRSAAEAFPGRLHDGEPILNYGDEPMSVPSKFRRISVDPSPTPSLHTPMPPPVASSSNGSRTTTPLPMPPPAMLTPSRQPAGLKCPYCYKSHQDQPSNPRFQNCEHPNSDIGVHLIKSEGNTHERKDCVQAPLCGRCHGGRHHPNDCPTLKTGPGGLNGGQLPGWPAEVPTAFAPTLPSPTLARPPISSGAPPLAEVGWPEHARLDSASGAGAVARAAPATGLIIRKVGDCAFCYSKHQKNPADPTWRLCESHCCCEA
jgi:hypothetical protein